MRKLPQELLNAYSQWLKHNQNIEKNLKILLCGEAPEIRQLE